MNIIVLTPVRLLGDGLAACFRSRPDLSVLAVVDDLAGLRAALAAADAHVVLIDVTQGVDLFDVRAIAAEWSEVALVALGLDEQRQEVIRCGRAGFARSFHTETFSAAIGDCTIGTMADWFLAMLMGSVSLYSNKSPRS